MPENKKKNKTFVLIALIMFSVITLTVTSSVLIIKYSKSEDTSQNKTKTETNSKKIRPKTSHQKISKGSKSIPNVVFKRPGKKLSVSVTNKPNELIRSNYTASSTLNSSQLLSSTNTTSTKQGTQSA